MSKITITEALQEIKTIGKRLEKKRASISEYLARDSRIRDPLEKDGGSEKYIASERQAIADLETRIVGIRTAIQRSNLSTSTTIVDRAMTVAEWLTWRREVSEGSKTFLTQLVNGIRGVRAQVQQKGGRIVAALAAVNESNAKDAPPEVVVNIDEKSLLDEQERMESVLGELDGKLSLLNATTTIEI